MDGFSTRASRGTRAYTRRATRLRHGGVSPNDDLVERVAVRAHNLRGGGSRGSNTRGRTAREQRGPGLTSFTFLLHIKLHTCRHAGERSARDRSHGAARRRLGHSRSRFSKSAGYPPRRHPNQPRSIVLLCTRSTCLSGTRTCVSPPISHQPDLITRTVASASARPAASSAQSPACPARRCL